MKSEDVWHCMSPEEVISTLNTSSSGLKTEEANSRYQQYGPNELLEKKKISPWLLFLNQFKDFMILVLFTAAIVSGVIGELTDTIIIIIIVMLNAVIGFMQEYRAEKAMEALKKMAALQSVALRDDHPVHIPSAELVPGDVILMEAGNAVPADVRLLESHSIRIDEAALTGESYAVDKSIRALSDASASLGDRINMAYKGTVITHGRAKGIVVATGMQTEIGKIASLLQENDHGTPLQRRMTVFGRRLSFIILGICLVLFVVGLLRGEQPLNMLLISISLAVAAIPEALPALITIALARGAKRMVQQHALIRRLPAVETLGSVSYICSDKTGTLTMNKMRVSKVHEEDKNALLQDNISVFYAAMLLNNDLKISADGKLTGDPTEIALVEYARKECGENSVSKDFPRESELPFDADRKCMTTVHCYNKKYFVVAKGAAESIAGMLKEKEQGKAIHELSGEWAANGLRVLAYGIKIMDQLPEITNEYLECDLVFAGLAGMIDPAREEVKAAIQDCRTAGIRPVMITGDHPATAEAIARELGLLHKDGLVMTGKELDEMTSASLEERVENVSVYARVSPEQKLTIVKALQSKNHFVAMTGDGVNDAPSLKAADIGVAMGITGTDVSREASDMILLDDNFSTIVNAVSEGRRIYDNIRKFVKYIMTCNSAEIWTIFLAPVLGLPMPLLPIHILWINLVTDGLPGLALAEEKAEKDIMKRPPRKTDESLFSGGIAFHIIWAGLFMAGISLGILAWAHYEGRHWQTMVFTVLSLTQLAHVMAIRSEKESLFSQGVFSNMQLFITVVLTFALQLAVIYLPVANEFFRTVPLTMEELLICIGGALVLFLAVEVEKWIRRRNKCRPK